MDIGFVCYNGLETQLIDSALQARIDAIEEIINEKTYHMEKLRGLLVNIPDLVKGLTRIQYGKVHFRHPDMTPKSDCYRPNPQKSLPSSSA